MSPPTGYKDKIISGTAWNFAGTILVLVIGLASSPLFVRYLGKHDYGVSVYISDIAILSVVVCSIGIGTFQAGVLPQLKAEGRLEQYKYLIKYNFILRCANAAGVLVLVGIASRLGFFQGKDGLGGYLPFFLIFVVLQVLLAVLRGPLQTEYQQKYLNMVEVLAMLGRVILIFPVIWFDLALSGFLAAEVVVEMGQLALLWRRFREKVWLNIAPLRESRYQGPIISRSLLMFISDFSSRLLEKEMDILLIGFLVTRNSFSTITFYSLSYLLVARSFSFLGVGTSNASTLLMNFSSELVSTGKQDLLEKLIEKQLLLLMMLVLPLVAGGVLLGEDILVALYGGMFRGKGLINSLLFVGFGFASATYVCKPLLFVLRRERSLVITQAAVGAVKVAALLLVVGRYGAVGASVVSMTALAALSLLQMFILRGLVTIRFDLKYLVKIASATAGMAGVVGAVHTLFPPWSPSGLLVCIGTGVCSYAFFLMLLKPLSQEDCRMATESALFSRFGGKRLIALFTASA